MFAQIRENRKDREDLSKFRLLRAAPTNLGTNSLAGLKLPGSGIIAFSYSASLAAGNISIAVSGGRTLLNPALVANQLDRLGWFEKSKTLTISRVTGNLGTISVFVMDRGRRILIATGVFS